MAFGIAGAALGAAEVFVEAHGIMALHKEQNALVSGFQALPFVIYLLFGTLATGTFLAFKIGRCWTTADRELRRSWMHHRERQWGQDTCGARAVQEAFQQCHRIARVKERLSDTRGRIRALVDEEAILEPLTECDEPLRERLRQAEIAAVAATDQFHGFVRSLLQSVGPPVPPAPARLEALSERDTGAA